MECKDCKYYEDDHNEFFRTMMCKISHRWKPESCTCITSGAEVEDMDICYNCKYWHGGGDWGLSCEKDYYNCSVNGFDKACEQFERR